MVLEQCQTTSLVIRDFINPKEITARHAITILVLMVI